MGKWLHTPGFLNDGLSFSRKCSFKRTSTLFQSTTARPRLDYHAMMPGPDSGGVTQPDTFQLDFIYSHREALEQMNSFLGKQMRLDSDRAHNIVWCPCYFCDYWVSAGMFCGLTPVCGWCAHENVTWDVPFQEYWMVRGARDNAAICLTNNKLLPTNLPGNIVANAIASYLFGPWERQDTTGRFSYELFAS